MVEGHGHSFLGTAPDKGEHHKWKKGDLIIVDHFLWHQHFNDDPQNQCRLVRIHMFDSILETMRALMDPMVLFEEAEDTLDGTPEKEKGRFPVARLEQRLGHARGVEILEVAVEALHGHDERQPAAVRQCREVG